MERTQVKPRCASQRLLRSPRKRLGMDRSRCPTEVQGARGARTLDRRKAEVLAGSDRPRPIQIEDQHQRIRQRLRKPLPAVEFRRQWPTGWGELRSWKGESGDWFSPGSPRSRRLRLFPCLERGDGLSLIVVGLAAYGAFKLLTS